MAAPNVNNPKTKGWMLKSIATEHTNIVGTQTLWNALLTGCWWLTEYSESHSWRDFIFFDKILYLHVKKMLIWQNFHFYVSNIFLLDIITIYMSKTYLFDKFCFYMSKGLTNLIFTCQKYVYLTKKNDL